HIQQTVTDFRVMRRRGAHQIQFFAAMRRNLRRRADLRLELGEVAAKAPPFPPGRAAHLCASRFTHVSRSLDCSRPNGAAPQKAPPNRGKPRACAIRKILSDSTTPAATAARI